MEKNKNNTISLSMFQCIVTIKESHNLKDCWNRLREDTNTSVKAFQPGSLGRTLSYEDTVIRHIYQIGSLSIKLTILGDIKLSILIFNNGKIKISGGLGKLECDDEMEDEEFNIFLKNTIIIPCLRTCFGKDYDQDIFLEKKIINANMRRDYPIGKSKYMEFIRDLTNLFGSNHIVLPDIMKTNGKRRGRICAVKVKNERGKGSFAVDHSGNVQFFAYDNIEQLKSHSDELLKVWS